MNQASISSQLGTLPCKVKDTQDILKLREKGDHRALGNALCGQYRYREAVLAYQQALMDDPNDIRLWQCFAGANLTLRNFRTAEESYRRCIMLGADGAEIAFYLGFSVYLQKKYSEALVHFSASYPCDEEQEISVIYWHTLAAMRMGARPRLLTNYREGMEIGHHIAYENIVRMFCGIASPDDIRQWLKVETDDLNIVIALYGLVVYYESLGQQQERDQALNTLLGHDQYWPCLSYLAAWGDDAFAE